MDGSDDDLALAARGGSGDALAELYRRYGGRILAYAVRLIGDRDAAEDVVQDVFAHFFRRLEQYRPEGRLASYLFRIAHSRATDEAVERRRRESPPPPRSAQEVDVPEPAGRKRLEQALEALPANLREVVVLRLHQNLDYAGVAAATGVSEATARSRMRYALEALRVAMGVPKGGSPARGEGSEG
jgi:RNA polymerase sigma factor (sigma-70 family)